MSNYLAFLAIGFTLLLHTMNSTAVVVAFPQISSSFNTSIVLSGWVMTGFQLATVVSVPIAGKAGDSLGRKRTFMFVMLLFVTGSFFSVFAPNIYWLIAFRVVQGAGAGGFVPIAVGLIAEAFPDSRQRSIGLVTTVLSVGSILGPYAGGWITEYFGWRYIFVFTVPFGLAALVLGGILLKESRRSAPPRLDLKGAGLFAVAIGSLMAGLTMIGRPSSGWPLVAFLFTVGLASMAVFVRNERQAISPMIDMEVIRGKPFVASNVFNVFFGFMVGVLTFAPLYAVTVYGSSTVESGIIVTPRTAFLLAASVVSSFFIVRWGYRKPMIVGNTLMMLALVLLAVESKGIGLAGFAVGGVGVMLALMALSGIGQGIASPAANNACIELMPDRISTITGMRQTFRNVGQALGIAIGSVGLESFGSLGRGFQVVLLGAAALGLFTIPCILAMPDSPSGVPCDKTERGRPNGTSPSR